MTGCSPFYGKSYHEIVQKNKKGDVCWDFTKINLKLSGDALDLLKRMLEKNPVQRISVHEALKHPWIEKFLNYTNTVSPKQSPRKLQLNIDRPLLKFSFPLTQLKATFIKRKETF